MKPSPEEIQRRFEYAVPTSEKKILHEEINELFITFAHLLAEKLPGGRELAIVLTSLQETKMWANAAIATNSLVPSDWPTKPLDG